MRVGGRGDETEGWVDVADSELILSLLGVWLHIHVAYAMLLPGSLETVSQGSGC